MNNQYKILIVDDNKDYLDVLEMIFESFGYECFSVNSGEKAIEYLYGNKCDLIISDYLMEKMSGMELLEKVKISFPDIKFFMISGNDNIKSQEEALKKGVDGYFVKGNNPQPIINKIEDFKKVKINI